MFLIGTWKAMMRLILVVNCLLAFSASINGENTQGYHGLPTVSMTCVIDSASLITDHPEPSKDLSNPTGLSQKYAFMVAPTKYVVSNQATAGLNISVLPGTTLRWYGTTEVGNSWNKVLVHNISWEGESIVLHPQLNRAEMECPKPNLDDITINETTTCFHYYLSAQVRNPGHMNYVVHLALYSRDDFGKPSLFGFFSWDPEITVI